MAPAALCRCIAPLLLICTVALASAQTDNSTISESSHLDLSRNSCLKKLNDTDPVIASIAFKDGAAGFKQLSELVERNPWGAITETTKKEIEQQLKTQSPFLIITLTKKQALALDSHRDLIRWVLVQSTTQICE